MDRRTPVTTYNATFARQVRLRRLFHHDDRRLFVVPLDHSVTDGPLGVDDLDPLVGDLAVHGVDAVVLHKGSLRRLRHQWFADMSLIVHLSASTVHAPDPNAKYLVASVEEALRVGADAVSVHVNVGSDEERRQIADLAAVSEACDRWSVPLLAMMYARGPSITDSQSPTVVAHIASLAADLGADIVKTVYPGSPAGMAEVVRACPVPVVTAGGARLSDTDAVLAVVSDVLCGGAAGVAMGRNIFQADHPGRVAAAVSALVHDSPRPVQPVLDGRLALTR